MILKIQIFALLFSFIFGILLAGLVNLNYHLLFTNFINKKPLQFFITFIFILDMALFYFLILRLINGGILHPYFLLLILIGFYIAYPFMSFFRKK